MVDFLLHALAWALPFDLGTGNPRLAAYRRAWRSRVKQQDDSLSLLLKVLKEKSVPGAYGPLDSDSLQPLVEAWTLGLTPTEARRRYGRKLELRSRPLP